MQLCLELGIVHPDLLDDLLTPRQYHDWVLLYQQSPFGDYRRDLRAAVVAMSAVQPHSKKKLKIKDFLLQFKKKNNKPLIDKARDIARAFGF